MVPLVFAVCGGLILWAVIWGRRFERRERRIKLGAAPFAGKWHLHVTPALIPAVLLAVVLVGAGRFLLPRLNDRLVLLWSALSAVVFAFSLAAADGLSAVLAPVVDRTEYWANLANMPSGAKMLRSYSSYDFLVQRSVHLKGHPPGFILLLKGLAAIGLSAPWVAGALSFLGIAVTVVAVGLTTRILGGPFAMRRMLPFFTVAPFLVWMATSADAFYTGVASAGVAFAGVGVARVRTRGQLMFGFVAGLLLGSALFLTYGAATLAPLVVAVLFAACQQPVRPVFQRVLRVGGSAVVGVALVFAAFWTQGFLWFRGLRVTNKFYWDGSAYFRTWTYFLLANVAVLIIAVGPAVIAGIVTLRNRRLWVLVGSAIVCLLIAESSQYAKGEVERIWLLFMPWLVPATAALTMTAFTEHSSSVGEQPAPAPFRWLAVQAALAVILQSVLRSKW
jgi:methylthioxylose transferase